MMTFGFSSMIDLLSWTVVALLGLKVLATVILLRRDERGWFRHRWSAVLWWSTKITPVFAVPCMIAVALLQHDPVGVWAYGGMMVFVVIAVPFVVWRRFRRPSSPNDLPA